MTSDSPTSYSNHNDIHGSEHSNPSPAAFGIPGSTSVPNSNASPGSMLWTLKELDNLRIGGIEALDSLERLDAVARALERDPSNLTSLGLGESTASLNDCAGQQAGQQGDITLTHDHNEEINKSKGSSPSRKPFKRWMESIYRRVSSKGRDRDACTLTDSRHHGHLLSSSLRPGPYKYSAGTLHHRASSASSFAFVGAVRSPSVSLASISALTQSQRNFPRSRCRTERSSRASFSMPRMSEDSFMAERPAPIDAVTIERSIQRRRVLEEIIHTEESYIGDVRFLMTVYVTILASLPSSQGLRSSINRNLTEIVELHEEILGELHRVIPDSQYNQTDAPLPASVATHQMNIHARGHRRWKSFDAVRERISKASFVSETPGTWVEPQVAAEVSKIFAKRMSRFFIYKEYGAKYEMMIKDISAAHRTLKQWESFQRGLEALASTISPVNITRYGSKKGLTINDLLVKPVQRICKYPLLFAQLLKYTLVCDCPSSHMEIESTLARLREAAGEINKATHNGDVKSTLEKTWLLQDRLTFPYRRLDAVTRNQIRSFGRIHLCGALHICWQAENTVDGQYMICLLYQDVLVLAEASKFDTAYTVMACIDLQGSKIEDPDNGRGLQCHTAPYSWKLVFESDYFLYEMIMTACSPEEEQEWRTRLYRAWKEDEATRDMNLFTSLELDMKHLGVVYGKPGTVARRVSIQRATTVGPKSTLCQVVLKNTSARKDIRGSGSGSLTINRSQSLLTTNRVPVLTPPRHDRARLEMLLSDVWSRDVLAFSGMDARSRSEHLVRVASSSMIRKFNGTPFGSFGRRPDGLSRRNAIIKEQPLSNDYINAGSDRCCRRQTNESTDEESVGPDTSPKRLRTALRQDVASSPSLTDSLQDKHADMQGTVRRMLKPGAKQRPSLFGENKEVLGIPSATIQQRPSMQSLQLGPSIKAAKFVAVDGSVASKETVDSNNDFSENQVRGVGRWAARNGILRADGKGHGFRGFFK